MPPSLDPVYRKLRRAEKHLHTLATELRAYDEAGAYTVTEEIDADDGSRVYRFLLLREPDPEWEITFGEIAYQLRSALDQLVTQLVVLNGGDADKHRGSFPIYLNAEDYWDRKIKVGGRKLNKRDLELQGVLPRHRTLIDAVQPYHRGKRFAPYDPLAVLHDLCIGDKHRTGQPAVLIRRQTSIEFAPNEVGALALEEWSGEPPELRRKPLEDGAEMFRFSRTSFPDGSSADPVKVGSGMFRVGVAFGKRQVFVFQMEDILKYIETEVVARFTPSFPASHGAPP